MRTSLLALLFAAIAAGCGGSAPRAETPSPAPTEPTTVTVDEVEENPLSPPANAPARGAGDAELTIQVFSDFECPFCARVGPLLDRLLTAYDGKIRVLWRNLPLPFHPNAALAAEAATEVHAQLGDAAFWRFHDTLFEHQRALARADLETYAAQIPGLDLARFRDALDQRRHRAAVNDDAQALARAGLPQATPTFLVGPILIQGAQPYELFADAIDALLGLGAGDPPAPEPAPDAD